MKVTSIGNATTKKHTNNFYCVEGKNRLEVESALYRIEAAYGNDFLYAESDEGDDFFAATIIISESYDTKAKQLKHIRNLVNEK